METVLLSRREVGPGRATVSCTCDDVTGFSCCNESYWCKRNLSLVFSSTNQRASRDADGDLVCSRVQTHWTVARIASDGYICSYHFLSFHKRIQCRRLPFSSFPQPRCMRSSTQGAMLSSAPTLVPSLPQHRTYSPPIASEPSPSTSWVIPTPRLFQPRPPASHPTTTQSPHHLLHRTNLPFLLFAPSVPRNALTSAPGRKPSSGAPKCRSTFL